MAIFSWRFLCLSILVTILISVKTAYTDGEDEAAAAGAGAGEGAKKKDDEELFEFKTPDLTEEEQHSQHMPLHMRCDGCRLISTMLERQFEKASRRRGSDYILSESEIIEAVEAVCENKYEDYGAKEVNGILRLTGPFTEVEKLPGVTSGGGKWPNRIRQLCAKYLDELGDDELYNAWHHSPPFFHRYLCYSPSRPRDACFKSNLAQHDDDEHVQTHYTKYMTKEDRERMEKLATERDSNAKKREEQAKSGKKDEL